MKKYIVMILTLAVFLTSCAPPAPPPPPELSVSTSSFVLMQGAQVSIHVKVVNPSKDDWQNYKLLVGYAQENDSGTVQISELPLSLAAGQTFEQEVAWLANFQPVEGVKYQVRLTLVSTENSPLGETSTTVEFVQPSVSVSINPTQLTQGSQAVINLQVKNPADVEMKGYTLSVGYGIVGDASSYFIQDLPINLKAGETFNQEITWVLDYLPSSGDYEVRAALIMPGSIFVTQAETPVTLTTP